MGFAQIEGHWQLIEDSIIIPVGESHCQLIQLKDDPGRRKPLSFLKVLTSLAPCSSPFRRDTKGGCALHALHYFLIWQSGSGPSTKPEGRRKQCGWGWKKLHHHASLNSDHFPAFLTTWIFFLLWLSLLWHSLFWLQDETLNGVEQIPISVWEIDSRFLLLPEHRARDGAEGLREEEQWYPATRQPRIENEEKNRVEERERESREDRVT